MRTKILFYLLLVALCWSCQKESETGNKKTGNKMRFNLTMEGVSEGVVPAVAYAGSRAVTTMPDVSFATYGFSLVGYHTDGFYAGTSSPNVWNYNTTEKPVLLIQKQTVDGKDRYETAFPKWPLADNSYITYFAWAQNGSIHASRGIVAATENATETGNPWIDVHVSDDPQYQLDIVASRAPNQLNTLVVTAVDLNFQHILSKLTFKLKSPQGVEVKVTQVNVKCKANSVSNGARFTLSPTNAIGTFTYKPTKHASTSYTLASDLYVQGTTTPAGEIIILPQKIEKGAIMLDVTYRLATGSNNSEITWGEEITRTISLPANELKMGARHNYLISLDADRISIVESGITDWVEAPIGLPIIAGTREYLLLLDAHDAPYVDSEGTAYWLDRSGYNRHCKIIGNVSHNKLLSAYVFSGGSGYVDVPEFPVTNSATIDFIARRSTVGGTGQSPINFVDGSQRHMFLHLGYGSDGRNYYFDGGGKPVGASSDYCRVEGGIDADYYSVYAFYRLAKDATRQEFRRSRYYANATISTTYNKHAPVNLNNAKVRKIGSEFNGEIKYVAVSNKFKGQITERDYEALGQRYALQDSELPVGYVKAGLMLDLRGIDAPEENGTLWKDQSGQGAHARLVGNVVYDPDKREYRTTNDQKNYLEVKIAGLLAQPNALQWHTLEIICYNSTGTGHNQVYIYGDKSEVDNRILFFTPSLVGDDSPLGVLHYQSPLYVVLRVGHTLYYDNTNLNLIRQKTQYQLRRSLEAGKTILQSVYRNGVSLSSKSSSTSSDSDLEVGTATRFFIGEHELYICAVRLYNRALTQEEITTNYKEDQRLYGLP